MKMPNFLVKKELAYFFISVVVAVALLCLTLHSENAEAASEFRIGAQLSNNACGTGEWSGSGAWDRDSDDVRGHLRVAVGPNGGCDGQSYRVDAVVDYQYEFHGNWFIAAGAGYDKLTLSQEYLPTSPMNDGAKFFKGIGVDATSLHIGPGYDFGENRYLQAIFNIVDNPLAKGGNAFPISLVASWQIGKVELNANTNTEMHQASATWDMGIMSVTGSVSNGYHKLDSPAPAMIYVNGNPATAAPPLETVYSLVFEFDL